MSTNLYPTNVDLDAIPPRFIHQLGRSRWVIDAQAFQTVTTDCHQKQPSVHQSRALEVVGILESKERCRNCFGQRRRIHFDREGHGYWRKPGLRPEEEWGMRPVA